MGVIAAIVAGVAVSIGALLIVTALLPARPGAEPVVKMRVDVRRLGSRALVAVMVAVLVLATTRWVLPALVCGALM